MVDDIKDEVNLILFEINWFNLNFVFNLLANIVYILIILG